MVGVRVPQDSLVPLTALLTLTVGTLSLFFVGFYVSITIFVVGWFLVTPALAILGDELEFEDDAGAEEDPIERLRARYAEGEIDEVEFEQRLDALVETEALDANDEAAIERAVNRLNTEEDTVEVERE